MIRLPTQKDVELAVKIANWQISQEEHARQSRRPCVNCSKPHSHYRTRTRSFLCGECFYKIPGVKPDAFTGPLEPAPLPPLFEDEDIGSYRTIAVRAMEDG